LSVDNIRKALDRARSAPARFGLRSHTVLVRVRTWNGARVGLGTSTDVDTALTTVDGFSPYVRQLSQKDVFASGGVYSDQDFEIKLTPAYVVNSVAGGFDPTAFDPDTTSGVPTELFFRISGAGIAGSGEWYEKKSQRADSSLTYTFVVSKTGKKVG
jgi:hypothetical protein